MAGRPVDLAARLAPVIAAVAAALPASLCSRGSCASCGACVGAGGSLVVVVVLRWLLRHRKEEPLDRMRRS